jgi:hypothetical protein
METVGETNSGAVEDFRESATERRIRVFGVIKRVLWWVGFVLLLPAVCSWFSELPIRFVVNFPHPVDFASNIWTRSTMDIWHSRLAALIYAGLGCWFLVGLINVVISLIRTSPAVRSIEEKVLKVVVTVVTFLVLFLVLVKLLFLSIDFSDTPQ